MAEATDNLVDVQIDEKWYRFPEGTRMIEACRQAEIDVPHYCYHPKLTSPGNCRMCLVEMGMPPQTAPGQDPPEPDADGHLPISWMPRPVIACANTIAPNMGIRSDSELTRGCRHGVMELLLINHPLDCPICDQAGECSLQEFSVEHGGGGSRFREQKVKKPKNVDIGPRIRLDDERCIMCSRCIRFTDEIADDPVLGFTDRGSHTTLSVHPGHRLANNYSLNTVDLCPVGALTSNDFRFQMRVWFLKETRSLCTSCGRGCNITIGSREDKLHRLTPRDNNDVNSSWMCDHGRLNFHYLDSEARLTDPLIKDGRAHRLAEWSETIAKAADSLGKAKGDKIAIIASARMTNEELFMARHLAAALDTRNIAIVPRIDEADNYLVAADRNPNTEGAKLILGKKVDSNLKGILTRIKSGDIKALIALDEDLFENGLLDKSDLKGVKFVASSHYLANPTANASHLVLPSATFAEKRGSMINVTGRLQRLNKAKETPGQAMELWEILRDLIQGLSGSNGLYLVEDVFKLMAESVKDLEGLSLSKIGDQGIALLETKETVPLLERERERIEGGLIVG